MRLSSLFSRTLISAESSSLRSMTNARFFWRRLMSSMALSSAISSPCILSTEDSMTAFWLQSSSNWELQSCIVKLELQAGTQIRATSFWLLLGRPLRQLPTKGPANNWQPLEKSQPLAPAPFEEDRVGDAENGASDHLRQSMVDQFDPSEALGYAEQQPDHFLPSFGLAVPDLVETVGHHHDHVRTRHPEAALARKLRPGVQLASQLPWKALFSSLSPIRQPEASRTKTLKCERRLEKGAASRQIAGMMQGRRLRQAQRREELGLGQAPICLKGKAHYQQYGAGAMIIIYKVEGAPSFSGHALMRACPNLVPRTQSHYPTAVRSHRPIVKNWLNNNSSTCRHKLTGRQPQPRCCWFYDGPGSSAGRAAATYNFNLMIKNLLRGAARFVRPQCVPMPRHRCFTQLVQRPSFCFCEKKGESRLAVSQAVQVKVSTAKLGEEEVELVQTGGSISIMDRVPGVKADSGELYVLSFTCTKCNCQSIRSFTKHAYHKGVVLVRCSGCQNIHLVADNIGWFEDKPTNVETMHEGKVRRIQDPILINEFLHRAFDAGNTKEQL